MTADITGLMQSVYDYFLGLFHPSDDTTSQPTYLLFQGIGTPITPEMFKLHAADATYLPALAVEQISRLANRVAPVGGTFPPTGKVVDDFYYMLLFGSQFAPESGDNTLFNALKAQALQKFDDQKLGSLLEPLAQFHPAYATPNDWYDPDAAANWTAYSVTSGEQTPPQGGGTPPPPPPDRAFCPIIGSGGLILTLCRASIRAAHGWRIGSSRNLSGPTYPYNRLHRPRLRRLLLRSAPSWKSVRLCRPLRSRLRVRRPSVAR